MADRPKSISDPVLLAQQCLAAAYLLQAVSTHLDALAVRLPKSAHHLQGAVFVCTRDHLLRAVNSLTDASASQGTCDDV